MMGVYPLNEALIMARQQAVDLVEIAPNATPPVCRLVDFGKFRYEQAKKDKESKKHQHANKVKEIQLSPSIDPHDFGVKLTHAIDFLCDDMKVKLTLKFRGREMAHKEYGFQKVNQFILDTAPYAHPDAPPKEVGKGVTVMLSPLPRAKRAKNPHEPGTEGQPAKAAPAASAHTDAPVQPAPKRKESPKRELSSASEPSGEKFVNNPFEQIKIGVPDSSNAG